MAIARAIVSDPTLLVCDEPTGDLDRATADEILTLLQMLNREHGKTIVMVTHDPKAAEYARRQLHLDKGTLANGARRAMRYLPLLWAGLFRKKTRTVLTLLSVVVAFLLFGLLHAVTVAFESGADSADAKRLLTTARYSIIELVADRVPAPHRAGAGRGGRGATRTGSAPSTRTRATPFRCSRWIPQRYLDMYPEFTIAADAARGLRQDAHRRRRRHAAGRALRLEARAEAADQLGDPPEGRRRA